MTSEDRGPELVGDELDVHHEESIPEVDITDILRTIGDALTELFQRVELLEARPQFAATIKTKR